MKLIDTTCPKCGANLKIDSDRKQAFCEYCGAQILIDDDVHHFQIDNAESAGYEFEKGRQRAQSELPNTRTYTYPPVPKKKRKIVWWVLGWIFIFPIPLTIIIIRNKKLKAGVKVAVIIAAWVVYLLIGIVGGMMDKQNNQERLLTTKASYSMQKSQNANGG